ncbi:hypothetical protein ACFL2P_02050 [Candidatus Moduliflexota bacterium]
MRKMRWRKAAAVESGHKVHQTRPTRKKDAKSRGSQRLQMRKFAACPGLDPELNRDRPITARKEASITRRPARRKAGLVNCRVRRDRLRSNSTGYSSSRRVKRCSSSICTPSENRTAVSTVSLNSATFLWL